MLSAIATLVGMLIMVLFPVLIPAMVSGVHFAAGWRRNSKDRHLSGRGPIWLNAEYRDGVTRSVIAQG